MARPSVMPRAIISAPENGRRGSAGFEKKFSRQRPARRHVPGGHRLPPRGSRRPPLGGRGGTSKACNSWEPGGSSRPCSPISARAARFETLSFRVGQTQPLAQALGILGQSDAKRGKPQERISAGPHLRRCAARRRSRAGFGARAEERMQQPIGADVARRLRRPCGRSSSFNSSARILSRESGRGLLFAGWPPNVPRDRANLRRNRPRSERSAGCADSPL